METIDKEVYIEDYEEMLDIDDIEFVEADLMEKLDSMAVKRGEL